MEAVVERLARSPRLPLILRDLEAFWKKEQKGRKRFYDSIEDGQKVEFINGKVIIHSPDTARHIEIRKRMTMLLDTFVAQHGLGRVFDEKALVCLSRNDYMPDVVLFLGAKAAAITPEQLQFPAPDLAVEVLSASTAKRDRGVKFNDYAAHAVAEYWIVDPEFRTVEIFRLDAFGKYELAWKYSGDDILRSEVLPDLKAPARALFEDAANLAAVRRLLR